MPHLKLHHTSESQIMFQTPAAMHFIIFIITDATSVAQLVYRTFLAVYFSVCRFSRWNTGNNLAVPHLGSGQWQIGGVSQSVAVAVSIRFRHCSKVPLHFEKVRKASVFAGWRRTLQQSRTACANNSFNDAVAPWWRVSTAQKKW